ncbi:Aspartic proteinase-like protein 2 [Apostasia shenzhenica]|uniref:Aspartic proteinase-like protein 2 n=1 Tax=Apostasia shenzhenica TaxID=1088818 RepID=A0A2I0ACK0_9ASPA|nr:Aspartic proteinase-like protein 2 [Apostasia shenzhenica]
MGLSASLLLVSLLILPLAGDAAFRTPRSSVTWSSMAGNSEAMVLPLFFSHPNSTRRSTPSSPVIRSYRRDLQGKSSSAANAHMRLYDDLLTNGYYTTRLLIGTPPQEFALIVDSGSTVTYVPCSSCEQCGNHQDPRFQPDMSSTYEPVRCSIDCTCNPDNTQCTYERQYAEMSSSSGVLGEDIVSFGKESALAPQKAVFGCETSETGDLFNQHADGIMGLGRGRLSIMDQLVDKGVISDSFSLCYGGMDIGGGAMVLGGMPLPIDMVFSRSDPVRSPYYNIELREIQVSRKSLHLSPSVFDGKHGTILDSGTTFAYLPKEAFVAFKDAITRNLRLKQIPGPDPNYKDICFSGAGSDIPQLSKFFPDVVMIFGDGQKLPLSPENYLFRHSRVHGAYCLGVFQNGNDPTTLLGGIIVRNTLVTYDRHNQRIGFWKTNCSELWKRLNIDVAPYPAPSASNNGNALENLSPALSPSGLQNFNLPGQYKIGVITFDISLSVEYSDLEPHIKDFTELIARELQVDISQVHLTHFARTGNSTLIRCAISPSGSDFISSTAATRIISRLTEHRIQFPANFGNYSLVKWDIEPSKRSWWQEHLQGIVVGVAVAVVVVIFLSTLLTLYFWRSKPGAYRHVNAAFPEQELQPM